MRVVMLGCMILLMAGSSWGQTLCPSHIETPVYPPAALAARVQSKVTLKVTINGDGKVTNVEPAGDPAKQAAPVLQKSAIDNIQRWTFEKPASDSVTQIIVYEYKFDDTLPVNDNHNPITKVMIDLPNHVTILANEMVLNPDKAKRKH
jgi:TonB family protein